MKYAYINGKILDGTKDMQVKEGFVILTDNDKIEDIVKAGTDLNGYEKVDLKGRYIMPGLINMHVHLAGNGKPQKKQRDNEKLVKILMGNVLMRSIAYGYGCRICKNRAYERCDNNKNGWRTWKF